MITVSMLSANSVNLSWSRPSVFSLPVVQYSVSLARVIGSDQALCSNIADQKPGINITYGFAVSFEDLKEFSTYVVTIVTTFRTLVVSTLSSRFTTLSAGTVTVIKDHNY